MGETKKSNVHEHFTSILFQYNQRFISMAKTEFQNEKKRYHDIRDHEQFNIITCWSHKFRTQLHWFLLVCFTMTQLWQNCWRMPSCNLSEFWEPPGTAYMQQAVASSSTSIRSPCTRDQFIFPSSWSASCLCWGSRSSWSCGEGQLFPGEAKQCQCAVPW